MDSSDNSPRSSVKLSSAANLFGGTLVNPDCDVVRVSIDSRTIAEGDVFVAVVGDRFDGHKFIGDVADKASGLVVQSPQPGIPLPQWVVADTTRALGQLAALKRRNFTGPVIAITGSTGKTTVKEMLASILKQMASVLATKGNFNNHIGVPLTLLSLLPEHEFAVIEMGASAGGDIGYLCEIAKPDISLINNVMPAHLSGFGSMDAIARAKGEIYEGLRPGGIAVLNLDEQYFPEWGSKAAIKNQLTYSLKNPEAGFFATEMASDDRGCWQFTMQTPLGYQGITLGVPGKHNIPNALAAAACAYAAGADLEEIAAGLANMKAASGRMQVCDGINGSSLIDDSYNANPGSVKAAIDALVSMQGKPVLVLGDMGELGDEAEQMHRQIGTYAATAGIASLLAVGDLSRHTVASFGEQGEHFSNKDELIARLKVLLTSDAKALIKGSRFMGMDTVVDALKKGGGN